MAIIDSIVESAAERYQNGVKIQPAVRAALREHGITDRATYGEFYKGACRILGKRGGAKGAELRRKSALAVRSGKRNPEQISLQFTR